MTPLTRADLAKVFKDPKTIQAFEQLAKQVATNTRETASNVEATGALQDATVITLSSNETFTNERILAVGEGLDLTDEGVGGEIVITLTWPIVTNAFRLEFNLEADSYLDLPSTGRLLNQDFTWLQDFADDTAAAGGGIVIGGLYRTASAVKVRVA